jgi:hypothetical protein
MSFFMSFDQCRFEVYFVRDKYCYSCLFSGAIGLVNLLPAFRPKPMFISVGEMGLQVSCKQQIVGSSFLIHFDVESFTYLYLLKYMQNKG